MTLIIAILIISLIIFMLKKIYAVLLTKELAKTKSVKSSEHSIISYPIIDLKIAIIGLVFSLSFIITTVIIRNFFPEFIILDKRTITYFHIFFTWLILFSIYKIKTVASWKIDICKNKDYFVFNDIIGKPKKIKYSECKAYYFYFEDMGITKIETLVIVTDFVIISMNKKIKNIDILIKELTNNGIKQIISKEEINYYKQENIKKIFKQKNK